MDRQTIEAAERVTAWCRARALSAVLAAPAIIAGPAQAAQNNEQPLRERSAAMMRHQSDQSDATDQLTAADDPQ